MCCENKTPMLYLIASLFCIPVEKTKNSDGEVIQTTGKLPHTVKISCKKETSGKISKMRKDFDSLIAVIQEIRQIISQEKISNLETKNAPKRSGLSDKLKFYKKIIFRNKNNSYSNGIRKRLMDKKKIFTDRISKSRNIGAKKVTFKNRKRYYEKVIKIIDELLSFIPNDKTVELHSLKASEHIDFLLKEYIYEIENLKNDNIDSSSSELSDMLPYSMPEELITSQEVSKATGSDIKTTNDYSYKDSCEKVHNEIKGRKFLNPSIGSLENEGDVVSVNEAKGEYIEIKRDHQSEAWSSDIQTTGSLPFLFESGIKGVFFSIFKSEKDGGGVLVAEIEEQDKSENDVEGWNQIDDMPVKQNNDSNSLLLNEQGNQTFAKPRVRKEIARIPIPKNKKKLKLNIRL